MGKLVGVIEPCHKILYTFILQTENDFNVLLICFIPALLRRGIP